MTRRPVVVLSDHDALIVVDVQYDFLPGGKLAVPEGDEVVGPLRRYLSLFHGRQLPIFATRDWHPPDHCSFRPRGPWPPHCIQGTRGAELALTFPPEAVLLSKATTPEKEAYSDFEGTNLTGDLRARGVTRVFVGGLATDYCVRATVLDALAAGFETCLLTDAIRAVNVAPDDGARAEAEMRARGAQPVTLDDLAS